MQSIFRFAAAASLCLALSATTADAYSPPKTVEQARKLVESDEILVLVSLLGTAGNSAIHKYMNVKKVPHLFLSTGANKWADHEHFPWTMGFLNNYGAEAQIYAQYTLKKHAGAKVGVIYQNDDFGKDFFGALRKALGKQIVSEIPFEHTTPTVDPMIVSMKSANPDIVFHISTPKFAAQGIRKIAELDWHPIQFLPSTSTSIVNTLKPAGLDNAKEVLSAFYLKDPNDPRWAADQDILEWKTFMAKWYPDGSKADSLNVYGYAVAQVVVQMLKQCGDDLARASVMKQAANLDMSVGVMLPGVRVKTSPTDFQPLEQMQMGRFNGASWELFGDLISARPE